MLSIIKIVWYKSEELMISTASGRSSIGFLDTLTYIPRYLDILYIYVHTYIPNSWVYHTLVIQTVPVSCSIDSLSYLQADGVSPV
jgi:hypothetical protein